MLTHDDADDNADDDHDDDDDHGDHDEVQQMRLCFNSIKPSEEAHKNPLRGKGLTDAQKVFQHYNW